VPGIQTADAGDAENRLLWRVPPSELRNTVLVKKRADEAAAAPADAGVAAGSDAAERGDAPAAAAGPDPPPSQ
jgi:hypothetical protein